MTKFLASIFAIAMAAGLAFAPQTAFAKHDNDAMRGHSMMAPGHMKRRCAPGHHWVSAHRRRNGTWVQGYCR
ncbi:MAG TPA: hypothetical protein VGD01_08205 [Candidatus Elarobacter sp.]|jgi:hypothetical protein